MQSAYTYAFLDIAKHFFGVLKRLDDPEINKFLSDLNFDPECITEAYTLKADLQIVVDIIHEKFEDHQNLEDISSTFISHASDILGDTNNGLTGNEVVKHCVDFAAKYDVDIPYSHSPLPESVPNKRTALRKNIESFSSVQQYSLISRLCEDSKFQKNEKVQELKTELFSRYNHLQMDESIKGVDLDLIENTKHWLIKFPVSYKLYSGAIAKYKNNVFQRNLLDDLRLSFESLCKEILGNKKSLENQIPHIGEFLKEKDASTELRNMYTKIIDYYCNYHNNYVKHDDAVKEHEIELIIELTSTIMKFLVRMANE
jgi:hypothetical protein